jgi:hypothetical protein
MPYSPFRTFPEAAQEAGVWVRELADLLGCEQRAAYSVLRATLHAVRDSLSVDDNAKIGNSLPVIVRGIYYEGWNPMKIATQLEPEGLSKRLLGLMPSTVSADGQVLAKILKLLEDRLGDKLPDRLDVALKVCTHAMLQMQLR